MASSSVPTVETVGLLLEEFPVLSDATKNFVHRYPHAAHLAVAKPLAAIAARQEAEDIAAYQNGYGGSLLGGA